MRIINLTEEPVRIMRADGTYTTHLSDRYKYKPVKRNAIALGEYLGEVRSLELPPPQHNVIYIVETYDLTTRTDCATLEIVAYTQHQHLPIHRILIRG